MRAVLRGQVYAVDGNQFFNRPGPRLIDSAEIAAAILHPESGAARTWPDDIFSHLTDFCGSL